MEYLLVTGVGERRNVRRHFGDDYARRNYTVCVHTWAKHQHRAGDTTSY